MRKRDRDFGGRCAADYIVAGPPGSGDRFLRSSSPDQALSFFRRQAIQSCGGARCRFSGRQNCLNMKPCWLRGPRTRRLLRRLDPSPCLFSMRASVADDGQTYRVHSEQGKRLDWSRWQCASSPGHQKVHSVDGGNCDVGGIRCALPDDCVQDAGGQLLDLRDDVQQGIPLPSSAVRAMRTDLPRRFVKDKLDNDGRYDQIAARPRGQIARNGGFRKRRDFTPRSYPTEALCSHATRSSIVADIAGRRGLRPQVWAAHTATEPQPGKSAGENATVQGGG